MYNVRSDVKFVNMTSIQMYYFLSRKTVLLRFRCVSLQKLTNGYQAIRRSSIRYTIFTTIFNIYLPTNESEKLLWIYSNYNYM